MIYKKHLIYQNGSIIEICQYGSVLKAIKCNHLASKEELIAEFEKYFHEKIKYK